MSRVLRILRVEVVRKKAFSKNVSVTALLD